MPNPTTDHVKKGSTMKENRFNQGYICAITTILSLNSFGCNSVIRKAFQSGIGKTTLKKLKEEGIEGYDLDILKEHWKELNKKY